MKVDWSRHNWSSASPGDVIGIVLFWENEDEKKMLEEIVRKHKQRTLWSSIKFEPKDAS